MITIRKSEERGRVNHGWLDSYHTFSFANYYDRQHMGFRTLRVINEDCISPGRGFGAHPHRDMEIISYALEGAIEHQDSAGNRAIIRPGDVQRMSAGTGIVHSEYNASDVDPLRLLQIWILPDRASLTPSYEQKTYAPEEKRDRLRLVVSGDGRDGSVTIHQDAEIYASLLSAGKQIEYNIGDDRHVWVQVIQGDVTFNGKSLMTGDAAAVSNEKHLEIAAIADTELLLFDLA